MCYCPYCINKESWKCIFIHSKLFQRMNNRTHIISEVIFLIFTLTVTIQVSSGGNPDNNWALPQMVSMMHSQVLNKMSTYR